MKHLMLALLLASASSAFAKLNVLCTTADLGAVVREIGGDAVSVEVIAPADRASWSSLSW